MAPAPAPKTDPGIVLYFHPHHLNSQKVLFALFENGMDFKAEEVNHFKGETFSPSFLQMSPCGELPVLKVAEGEFHTKFEDILDHIAKKDRTTPDAAEKYLTFLLRRLDMDALSLGCLTYFDELGLRPEEPYLSQRFRDRMKEMMTAKLPFVRGRIEAFPQHREGLKVLAKRLEDSMTIVQSKKRFNGLLAKLITIFAICENELKLKPAEESRWLFSSSEIRVADIHFGFLLHHLFEMGLGATGLWKGHPHVVEFYLRFKKLPSFEKVMSLVNGNEVKYNERKVYGLGVALLSFLLGFATLFE